MSDTITLTGVVATEPNQVVTTGGLGIASFRLASTHRYFDRREQKWVDGDTNWFTVSAFRQLGDNVHRSVQKGQRVIVRGRLKVRAWEKGDRSGIAVEIEADAVGHDLNWGASSWQRVLHSVPTGAQAGEDEAWARPGADAGSAESADALEPTPF